MSNAAEDNSGADEELALRAAPRPVTRFNRGALMVVAAGAGVLIFAALMVALRPPRADDPNNRQELYNVTTKPRADGLDSLPASYADVKPQIGAPMPGDLGGALLQAQQGLGVAPTPSNLTSATPFRPSPEDEAARAEALRQAKLAIEAREGQVFFQLSQRGAVEGNEGAASAAPTAGQFEPFTVATHDETQFGPRLDEDPNRQARKLAFLGEEVDADIYNPHRLQDPVSPNQVMAGTIIPASLMTGINSDLPGQVIAQVTQNVYDTVTGDILLIPQGARLIGEYDSVVAFGRSRALVVWSRIIFPNGASMVIENLPGTDAQGFAGLEDEVDFHTWRLLKGIVLSTLLGVGTELSFDDNESDIVEALRESAQSSANQAGQRLINRTLSIQPTITIRQGWPLRVVVNKDLVLRPYKE